VAQSHVLDTIEKSTSYLKYKQSPLLVRNTGKGFCECFGDSRAGHLPGPLRRACSLWRSGQQRPVDVVLGVLNDSPLILRNDGTKSIIGWGSD